MVKSRAIGWRAAAAAALGVALLAPVVATASPADAQSWRGFSVSQLPSGVRDGASEGWALAVTRDLGGPGVDVWNNNHGSLSEAIVDVGSANTIRTAIDYGSEITVGPDSHGVAFSDFDNDGDDDLIEVTGRNNNNRIFRNDGGELVAVDAGGLEDFFGRGRQPLFADFDGDGDMDVIVTNLDLRSDPVPQEERQLIPSEVYLNNGDGTVWTKAPDPNEVLDDGHVRIAQLTSTGPGTPGVVVTHDVFTLAKDSIALDTGSATLQAPANAVQSRTNPSLPIREVLIGDFDGDLYPEFIVFAANASPGNGLLPVTAVEVTAEGNAVTVSIPGGADLDNCRSGTSGDFDNDGDLDIIAGCTQVQEGQDRNVLLLNDGNGNFSDAGTGILPRTGADTAAAMLTADINGDGWLDAIVANGYDFEPGEDDIITNRGGSGAHWLGIDLVGSNPDAIGAQVFVGTDDWQVRETGHAYHRSQDSRTLHFGLGDATSVAPVEIQWPDGTFETCTVGAVDRRVTITQGGQNCVAQTRAGLLSTVATAPAAVTGPTCASLEVTVNLADGEAPTAGDDVILGTANADVINGLGGNDTICGLGGDDIINGGAGNDRIIGAAGDDTLNGDDGFDQIFAGAGDDTVRGGTGNDTINGGDGVDNIAGENGNDRIMGGGGDDVLNGNGGFDRVAGGNGNDLINGGSHDDELLGNLGLDRLNGDRGSDVLRGGLARDVFNGGAGDDGCTLTDPNGVNEPRISCEGGVFGR